MRRDWIEIRLEQGTRRSAAESLDRFGDELRDDEAAASFRRLSRMLRVGRDEFLLDHDQAHDLLTALDDTEQLSTLRARLRAFIAEG